MAKRNGKKWIVRLALLAAAAALCAVGWDALRPLVMAETTPVYAQYTVETGDIETSMSLSGTIELVSSESFAATERTTVQEIYVEADQMVSAGTELLRLANGETFTANIDGTVTSLNVSVGDAVCRRCPSPPSPISAICAWPPVWTSTMWKPSPPDSAVR